MARKRGQTFPSDHRRYFRVMEDILHDPKIARAGNDGLAAYIRILALLNQRKSKDGRIALDSFTTVAIAGTKRSDSARRLLERLSSLGLFSIKFSDEITQICVPKWAEIQGIAPTKPRRRPSKTPPPTPTPTPTPRESAHDGARTGAEEPEDPLGLPPGYESPSRLLSLLRLSARASEAERAVWAESVWIEVVAAAEDEVAEQGGTLANRVKRILSARWNAYLRERDPERRQYHREAHLRALQAAKSAVDRPRHPDPPEPMAHDDDPLALLRTGVNPHVTN